MARRDSARSRVRRFMDLLGAIGSASGGTFRLVTGLGALQECLREEALGAILHFEGLDPIGRELDSLERYYERGLRSAGIVWQRDNPFACAATPDPAQGQRGLTDLGRHAVRECNRLGILVDLSHMNEGGFRDVAAISDAPLIATHSNAFALSPHCRNLKDYQLDAIRDSSGIVGVTLCSSFLRDDLLASADTAIEVVVRHVDYISSRIGIEHVGFGSDFDGAVIPQAIGDAAGFPALVEALKRHGFDDESVSKITHGNWTRGLRQTWRK